MKSGQVLLIADFTADGDDIGFTPATAAQKKKSSVSSPGTATGAGGAKSARDAMRKPSSSDHDGPTLHVDLIKAKNLIKADMIGKSDPYAVLKYRNQKDKTPVMKNNQNPEWNHSSDFEDLGQPDLDLV